MIARSVSIAVTVLLAQSALSGTIAGGDLAGGAEGFDAWGSLVRCSGLSDPAEPAFALDPSDDLHAEITANCGSGCILDLAPGTYSDTRATIGPGADPLIRAGSLTGATGTILIRGADPLHPPLIRAQIGAPTGPFYLMNVDALVRLEDVVIDGRRSEQTNGAVYDPCEDTTPADGVCDSSDQSFSSSNGFSNRRTVGGNSRSCLLRVHVMNTVADAIFLRDAADSMVEDSSTLNTGCTPDTCPGLSIPADNVTPSVLTVGRGINYVTATSNVGAVGNSTGRATKMGLQCIHSVDCHLIGNSVDEALSVGVSFTSSSGSVRGNAIRRTGFWAAQISSGAYVGKGIQWTTDVAGSDVVIDGNTVSDSWGAGIAAALPAGVGDSDAEVEITRNVVERACLGTDRPLSAAIELGDNVDGIASLRSVENRVGDHQCDSGFRVQRFDAYHGRRNSVSGAGTNPAMVYDDQTSLDEASIVVDENIEIDAGSAGTLSGCTLSEGAVVNNGSGGAVTVTGC